MNLLCYKLKFGKRFIVMFTSYTICFQITLILILPSLILGNTESNQYEHLLKLPHQMDMMDSRHISPPKPGWIDPFDMLGERQSPDSLFVQSEVEIHTLQKRCNSYEIYLRRFVNLFLNAVELKNGQVNSMNLVKLEFYIDSNDVNTLKEFGLGEKNAGKIESVSDVFTKIFSQKTSQDRKIYFLTDFLDWLQRIFLKIITSPEWTVLSSVLLLLFLTVWLVYRTHSYRLAVFTVLLTIFLAGFGFTWIRMYEEKEIEKYVHIERNGVIPRHCSSQSQSMAWYEHMYYRMFGVNCQEFYKVRDVRTIVKVSPVDVLAETFSTMIVRPASHVGKAYGRFVNGLIEELPWYLKPFGVLVSLAVPLVFIAILLCFLCNYSVSFSITGFHLKPSRTRVGSGRDRQYVEDCPRREANNTNLPFLDSDTPLFVMNWKGLKKLSSSSLLAEKIENKAEPKETVNEDEQPLRDETESMMENLKEFEEFVESMETQKYIEERRKRSIHTCTEGESSLNCRRVESKNTLMDSPFGDGNKPPTNTAEGKNFKDKIS